jgi:hypothetical protein
MSFLPNNPAVQFAGTLLAAALLDPDLARAQTQTALYDFAPNAKGEYRKGAGPQDELIEAPDGSFFTTTHGGGDNSACPTSTYKEGCGTVVQLKGTRRALTNDVPGSVPSYPQVSSRRAAYATTRSVH